MATNEYIHIFLEQCHMAETKIEVACGVLNEVCEELTEREFDVDEQGQYLDLSKLRDDRNVKILELANLVREQEDLLRASAKLLHGATEGQA